MELLRTIPTPEKLKADIAVPLACREQIKQSREILIDTLTNKTNKMLLLVGPCSADNEDAVVEYASRLAKLQQEVEEKFLIVPRVFTAKPRRQSNAYKGLVHQPQIDSQENMAQGIIAARKLHVAVAYKTGLLTADEMLYPDIVQYTDDVVSYWVVGARSVENQQHKLVASGMVQPVGMKNPMNGDLRSLMSAVDFTKQPHHFILSGNEYVSEGNALTHAILRGYVDNNGTAHSNYDMQTLGWLAENNQTIIVDCNHHNSGKNYLLQPKIAKEVLKSISNDKSLQKSVRGLMLESYLSEGKRRVGEEGFGKSLTDACLGWQQTEELIKELAAII
ncbi:MAG: 3-deoxy-7-phosphoheptulonate synthase [Paludibacteraceae bacterium]|nr:3-deoxy-7-phosphoheptulonate synthase [Paludibacteraceae bacterium]